MRIAFFEAFWAWMEEQASISFDKKLKNLGFLFSLES
jgi:hypothetical protein